MASPKAQKKERGFKKQVKRFRYLLLACGKRWRDCSDFDSWVRTTYPYSYLDGACIRDFKASYNPPNRGFPEWLQYRAEEYMRALQELLQRAGIKGIEWFKSPVADESVDKLIWLFGLLLRETPHMPPLDSHRIYHCYNVLRDSLSGPDLRADPALDRHNQSLCVAVFGKEEPKPEPPKPQFGSQWRNCETVDDFVRHFNLDDDVKGYIVPPGSKIKPDLPAWLKEGAKEYLDVVLRYLRKGNWEGISYGCTVYTARFSEDVLIQTYAELMRISPYFDMQRLSSYHEALLRLLPIDWHRLPVHRWKDGLFPRRSLHDATGPLYEQILHRFYEFNSYGSHRNFAPYTALVGAGGYGKSFFVQQLAVQGYTYVVYLQSQGDNTHLQWYSSESYTLANSALNGPLDRQRILECFIAVSLFNVKLCRDVGIGPRAFFNMQTGIAFRSSNDTLRKFTKVLWTAFAKFTQTVHHVTEQIRPPGCPEDDDKYWNQALKYCLDKYAALMWSKFFTIRAVLPIYQAYHEYQDPPSGDTTLKEGNPAMVLCIDELPLSELWLPSEEPKWPWYNEMIKAISSRVNHDWDASEDRFFALFVHRDSSDMPPNPNHPFPDIQIEQLK
ncbi:hypothetical protein IFM58399_06542 [Aspergillus lentulus]|uniref:uncharacterized protein n=1 Tax=Aspergillus lentulus TaxID=293939 RepID=UPI0013953D4F|nr:uncharacterized protein IFM58399_06542 [Aspergillus lentulus]GFF42239.1 hypothetical protein IFM58399_06542 [Aspergillus lentulus]GFG01630.1 hypothetical protein IFM61392_01888 [Aspergillus lentulus]